MKPTFAFAFGLFTISAVSPMVRGQAVLDQTTLGQSQNDARDLQNSLTAAPQKYGKGDKKSEINAAELKSKTIRDSTFGGSLLNMGIDSAVPKLDETKLRNAPTEAEKQAAAAKQQAATTAAKEPAEDGGQRTAADAKEPDSSAEPVESQAIFSNLSTTATLADGLVQADANAALEASNSKTSSKPTAATSSVDAQKKNQDGGTSSAADKSSTTKPDGDH